MVWILVATAVVTGSSTACDEVDACLDLGGAWDHDHEGCVFGDVDDACGLLAHGTPAFRDGRPVGFKMFSVFHHPAARWYGVQDGDVLERLNGVALDSIEHAQHLVQALDHCRHPLVLQVRRGEQQLTLTR